METLEQLEKKINDMVEKKHQEITKVQAKLDKTIATIDKAKKDLATAKETIDGDTYVKAKLTLEKATAEKELYSSVLDDLRTKTLLPYADYKMLYIKICKASDALQADLRKKAPAVLPQLKELSDQSNKIWDRTNALLETMKKDISNGDKMAYTTKRGSGDSSVSPDWGMKYEPGFYTYKGKQFSTMAYLYDRVEDYLTFDREV